MKAIVIARHGGPEVLELRDVAVPVPREDEVLVRVRATAINRADLLQRAGRYPAPPGAPADVPGLEFAGEVAGLGAAVGGWSRGDRVFGIAGGGAYAEYVAVHEGALLPIPPRLDWTTAAAVPEAFITAHDALITQARLAPGETVLIHAVGSGVGLAAVQVARWRGATAYGTTRTPAKLDAARAQGLADGIVVAGDLTVISRAVRDWTGDGGIDVILDLVGGPYVGEGLEALATRGRLVVVGTIAGHATDLRLDRLLRKRATIRGTVLRARTAGEKAEVTAAFARDLLPGFERGTLAASVDRILPLAEAAAAHHHVQSDANIGKVVLTV